MAIENLLSNMEAEKQILNEIFILTTQLSNVDKFYPYEKREAEKKIIKKSLDSLVYQMKIISNAIVPILESLSPYNKIEEKAAEEKNFTQVEYKFGNNKLLVTIKKEEKTHFLKEFALHKGFLGSLKRKEIIHEEGKLIEVKKTGLYSQIANKIFLNTSTGLIEKYKFKKLSENLKKANMPFLLATFISVSLFSSLLVLIGAIFLGVFLSFFSLISLTFSAPTIERVLLNILLVVISPFATFFAFQYYPGLEASSIGGKINRELPFVAMHMSAIAGSGIEPSQIFKIVASGEEYPETKKEMRKIINQINIYGYDLVTALKIASKETSSIKFGELLSGLATTISGGGSLKEFLEKRSETLLFEYKIDKEKETRSAETFMDLYISLVITTPMVMTLLLVIINVSMSSMSLSMSTITIIMIGIVTLINLIFLGVLKFKHEA